MAEGGAVPFGQEAYVKDENGNFKTDEVTISKNFRTLTFPKSTSIEQIIEEVVILSAYAKESATQLKADGDGMIDWFRVHTQTFLIPDESVRKTTGENPKVYVYAVVPYKVHSSVFSGTSQPSVGLEKRKKQAAKRYDYIYTGKNDDIIDFDINFNNAFYNALQPNINGSGDAKNVARDSANASTPETYVPADGNTEGSGFSDPSTLEDVNNSGTGGGGGGGVESPAVKVSRMFNDAIVNSAVDMITMDLTVLGDPYYLADSGLGNYSSPAAARGYTSDGSMDYQRSEVEVDVNFRTPIDYNDDGGMTFPQRGTEPVGQFSGLYKVLTVQNTFSGGKFTQVLSLLRRKKQDDANIAGVAGDENKAVVSGPEGNVDKNVITPASATETTSTAFVGPPGPV